MRNKFIVIAIMFIFVSVGYTAIDGHNTCMPNMNVTATPSSVTPDVTPADGTCYVEGTLEVDGAARFDSTTLLTGKVTFTDGINQEMVLIDAAASSQTSFFNFSVSTAAVIASATTYTLANGDYTDIIVPRNLIIISSCVPTSATYSGTALVTGIDAKGNSATESITVSTSATNYGVGLKAWSSITSIRFTSTATNATSMSFQVGGGVKIGLPCDIQAAGDVYKVIEAAALTTTYTLNTTYDTITFVNAPDGSKDYSVFYKFIKR